MYIYCSPLSIAHPPWGPRVGGWDRGIQQFLKWLKTHKSVELCYTVLRLRSIEACYVVSTEDVTNFIY